MLTAEPVQSSTATISGCSLPDVARAVPAWIANLMSQNRTVWLCPKVHIEIRVELQSSIDSVHIYLQDVRALCHHVGVELLVPGGEEAVGHIQSLPIPTARTSQTTAQVHTLYCPALLSTVQHCHSHSLHAKSARDMPVRCASDSNLRKFVGKAMLAGDQFCIHFLTFSGSCCYTACLPASTSDVAIKQGNAYQAEPMQDC